MADGLSYPHGIAVLDGVVYISDQGTLPCDEPFPVCLEPTVEGEIEMIRANEGRVVAFDLAADGSLENRRVVVDGLPVVSTEHALHDIEAGPNGRLYLSIGGVDWLGPEPERIADVGETKTQYLGTVVSFLPEGDDLQIHASGIRNIYGLTLSQEGELLGADNDGPAGRDWRLEELLEIRAGADFGYPEVGSHSDRDEATTILSTGGAAGIEWAEGVGLGLGVLVGDIDNVDFVPLARDAEGLHSPILEQTEVLQTRGYVTTLEALPGGLLLVGIFQGFSTATNRLLIVEFDDGE